MVAGFELGRGYDLGDYDAACRTATLTLVNRWATWDCQPFLNESDYAVSYTGAELGGISPSRTSSISISSAGRPLLFRL